MKKTDLWWLCGYPVYQVIGTIRHEMSHALGAVLQGATLTEISVLPSLHPQWGFFWGYVRWVGGHADWLTAAAPYFCDLIVAAACVPLCLRLRRLPRWLWLNLFILGLLSPFFNLAYNYLKVLLLHRGDVAHILAELPDVPVHLAFVAALLLVGFAAARVSRASPP